MTAATMTARGPRRKVVRLVQRKFVRVARSSKGREYVIRSSWDRELLECGHLFEPPVGLHGTTIGDRDSRRCAKCYAGLPKNDLTGWTEL